MSINPSSCHLNQAIHYPMLVSSYLRIFGSLPTSPSFEHNLLPSHFGTRHQVAPMGLQHHYMKTSATIQFSVLPKSSQCYSSNYEPKHCCSFHTQTIVALSVLVGILDFKTFLSSSQLTNGIIPIKIGQLHLFSVSNDSSS